MKSLLLILFTLIGLSAAGQPIVNRAGAANTVQDVNFFAAKSFRLPVANDTTQLNTYTTLDSCGKMAYTYIGDAIWYRSCSPYKHWVLLPINGGGGNNVFAKYGLTKNIDTIGLGGEMFDTSINIKSHDIYDSVWLNFGRGVIGNYTYNPKLPIPDSFAYQTISTQNNSTRDRKIIFGSRGKSNGTFTIKNGEFDMRTTSNISGKLAQFFQSADTIFLGADSAIIGIKNTVNGSFIFEVNTVDSTVRISTIVPNADSSTQVAPTWWVKALIQNAIFANQYILTYDEINNALGHYTADSLGVIDSLRSNRDWALATFLTSVSGAIVDSVNNGIAYLKVHTDGATITGDGSAGSPLSSPACSAWSLFLNTGTDTLTNAMGTADPVDLLIKTNELTAIRIDTLQNTILYGDLSLLKPLTDYTAGAYRVLVQDNTTKKTGYATVPTGTGTVTSVTASSPLSITGTPTINPNVVVDTNTTNIGVATLYRLGLKANSGANSDITSMSGLTGGISSPNAIIFTGVASPTYVQGKLVYDTDNQSLTFYNSDANVGLQIGQEEWIKVINNTGVTIVNGAAVYISGSSGGTPTIALAQANAGTTSVCAGLTTENITNGSTGYVTTLGVVYSLNTSAFSVGAIYLDATTAGAVTQTAPLAPNYRYRLGFVTSVNSTTGTIHVTPSTASLGNGTANQVFGMNNGGTAQEVKSIVGGTNVTVVNTPNTITINSTGGGGSQTLQQTFNQEVGGSILTKNDSILLANKTLNFLNGLIYISDTLRIGSALQRTIVNYSSYHYGTSIIAGFNASIVQRREVNLLAGALHTIPVNYGVSGSALQSTANSISGGASSLSVTFLTTTPIPTKTAIKKWLIIAHGENDAAFEQNSPAFGFDTTNFKTQYKRITDTAIARGWSIANIIIVSPHYRLDVTDAIQTKYFNAAHAFADANGFKWVDIWTMGKFNVLPDLRHPPDMTMERNAYIETQAMGNINPIEIDTQKLVVNGVAEVNKLYLRNRDTANIAASIATINPDGLITQIPRNQFVEYYGTNKPDTLPSGNIYGQGVIDLTGTINSSKLLSVTGNSGGGSTDKTYQGAFIGRRSSDSAMIFTSYNPTYSTYGNIGIVTSQGKFFIGTNFPANYIGTFRNSSGYSDLAGAIITGALTGATTGQNGMHLGFSGTVCQIQGFVGAGGSYPVSINANSGNALIATNTDVAGVRLQVLGNAFVSTKLRIGRNTAPTYSLDIYDTTISTMGVRAENIFTQQSINTTANPSATLGIFVDNRSTRSAGANNLWNIGVYGRASGGQLNSAGVFNGSVNIGDSSANDASAVLDVKSTTQGILIPRMTSAQRVAISSPATGLQVYDTDVKKIGWYDGTVWNFTSSTLSTPTVVASADLTAQSAATNIVTYTTGAADSTFEVSARLNVTAIVTDVIEMRVTYTDETNTSRTITFYNMGSTTSGLSVTGVSGYSVLGELRVKASTTITVATVLTTGIGTITYNAGATIKKVR